MMKKYPSISALLCAPAQTTQSSRAVISVGIHLNNNAIVWTNCNLATHTSENFQSIKQLIDLHLAPLLVGKSLSNIPELIDALATVERTIRHEETVLPEPSTTVSRRQFISSEVTPQAPQPELVVTESLAPLPPNLVGATAVLLLKALAAEKQQSPVELLAELYDQPITKFNPRPTHFKLPRLGDKVQPYSPTTLSMGYAVLPFEEKRVMGKGAEKFQKQVRDLKTHLRSCQPKGKYLYLELIGAYGRLYDHQIGRILGACSGLERAVKPCSVFLEDPIIIDDEAEQVLVASKLKDYFRLRKLKTKIIAHFGVDSELAIQNISEQKTAHGVRLSLSAFQNFSQLIVGMKTAVSHDLDLILGDAYSSPELLAWLGILFQTKLLYTSSPYQTVDTSSEMYRTTTALNRRAGHI
ncbi:MAG: hypothetical protein AAF490_09385 [Chloroflexota bacterium]